MRNEVFKDVIKKGTAGRECGSSPLSHDQARCFREQPCQGTKEGHRSNVGVQDIDPIGLQIRDNPPKEGKIEAVFALEANHSDFIQRGELFPFLTSGYQTSDRDVEPSLVNALNQLK